MRGTDNIAFSSQIAIINRKLVCMMAVSYTHLDVYKRQDPVTKNWIVNDNDLGICAEGKKGADGKPGAAGSPGGKGDCLLYTSRCV